MQGHDADCGISIADESNESDCHRFRVMQIRVRDDAVSGQSVISQVILSFAENMKLFVLFIQIITMHWTMTASDRRDHAHLERELQVPKRGAPSLAEAHWEALRCYRKPVLPFLIYQK